MITHRVIARCVKCRGELLPNGICPNCDDPGASVERLRGMIRERRPRPRPPIGPALVVNRPLSGQDAALPPGDRE